MAAWLAGIYVPRLPKIPKLDFRVEGGYTDPPSGGGDISHGAFYWDPAWITGFQNAGRLMGSWMGRQGQGAEAWTHIGLSPRTNWSLNFRHQKVSAEFIPGGGTLTDFAVAPSFSRGQLSFFCHAQYLDVEFSSHPTANMRSDLLPEISFWPKGFSRKPSK